MLPMNAGWLAVAPGNTRAAGLQRPGGTHDDGGGLEGRSLRRIFLDLIGRPPMVSERAEWMGRRREDLVIALLSEREFWENWLEDQLYYFLLVDGFRPRTEGVASLPEELAEGRVGVIESLHRICLSSSFERRNPGPDTFVTVVMEQLLGVKIRSNLRELEIGKRVYDGGRGSFLGRPGNSQADVVRIAIEDKRTPRYFLRREYSRWLRREPGASEVEAWADLLGGSPKSFVSIVRDWFLSASYEERLGTSRTLPNRLFVRALFTDLCGRPPTEEETNLLRSALDGLADPAPLRSLVVRILLGSGKVVLPSLADVPDLEQWVLGEFESLLGRPPTPGEATVFLESAKEPACRAETILLAILTHPEYQSW